MKVKGICSWLLSTNDFRAVKIRSDCLFKTISHWGKKIFQGLKTAILQSKKPRDNLRKFWQIIQTKINSVCNPESMISKLYWDWHKNTVGHVDNKVRYMRTSQHFFDKKTLLNNDDSLLYVVVW